MQQGLSQLILASSRSLSLPQHNRLVKNLYEVISQQRRDKGYGTALHRSDFLQIFDKLSPANQQSLLRIFRSSPVYQHELPNEAPRFLLSHPIHDQYQSTKALIKERRKQISAGSRRAGFTIAAAALCTTRLAIFNIGSLFRKAASYIIDTEQSKRLCNTAKLRARCRSIFANAMSVPIEIEPKHKPVRVNGSYACQLAAT